MKAPIGIPIGATMGLPKGYGAPEPESVVCVPWASSEKGYRIAGLPKGCGAPGAESVV